MANFCKYCGTALEETGLCACDTARAERAVMEARRRVAAATQQASDRPVAQAAPVARPPQQRPATEAVFLPQAPAQAAPPSTPAPVVQPVSAATAMPAPAAGPAPMRPQQATEAVTATAPRLTGAPVPLAVSGLPDGLVTPAAAKAAVAATVQTRTPVPLPSAAPAVSLPKAAPAIPPVPMAHAPMGQLAQPQPTDTPRPTGTTAILRPQKARPSPAALAQGVETVELLQDTLSETEHFNNSTKETSFSASAQEAASFAPIQAVQFEIPSSPVTPIASQVFGALAQAEDVPLEALESPAHMLMEGEEDITIHTNKAPTSFVETLGAAGSEAVHSALALWQAPDTAAGALGKELFWPAAVMLMGLQALAAALFALVVVLRLPGNAPGNVCMLAFVATLFGSGLLSVALAVLLWGGARLMGSTSRFSQGLSLAGTRSAAVIPVTLAAVVAALVYPLAGVGMFALGILVTAAVLAKATDALETAHNGLRTHLAAGVSALLVLLQLGLLRGAAALFSATLVQQFAGFFA